MSHVPNVAYADEPYGALPGSLVRAVMFTDLSGKK